MMCITTMAIPHTGPQALSIRPILTMAITDRTTGTMALHFIGTADIDITATTIIIGTITGITKAT